jgi:hypothetical protein
MGSKYPDHTFFLREGEGDARARESTERREGEMDGRTRIQYSQNTDGNTEVRGQNTITSYCIQLG